uniref:Uncharacterized protein n=1 Tax=Oryza brachyantha TaxID=4533 RepID=J3M215_ORYBR
MSKIEVDQSRGMAKIEVDALVILTLTLLSPLVSPAPVVRDGDASGERWPSRRAPFKEGRRLRGANVRWGGVGIRVAPLVRAIQDWLGTWVGEPSTFWL